MGEGWRQDAPSPRVDAPKKGRPLPKVLSREEMDRLIAAAGARDGAQGLRLACMIELAYASGLRISELTGLTLAALARDPAYLIVRGKGGKERLAPLNAAARAAVKAYLEARKPAQPTAKSKFHGPTAPARSSTRTISRAAWSSEAGATSSRTNSPSTMRACLRRMLASRTDS